MEVKELFITLSKVMEGLKEVPRPPQPHPYQLGTLEADFDTLCNALLGTNVNTPVIVNCQVGLPARPLAACAPACSARVPAVRLLRGSRRDGSGVNLELLRMDNYQIDLQGHAFHGEFEVVQRADHATPTAPSRGVRQGHDKNGPKPLGTGIKQLRRTWPSPSSAPRSWTTLLAQAFHKTKIMDNIHQKYFYLLCFHRIPREMSKCGKDGTSRRRRSTLSAVARFQHHLHREH